MSAADSVPDWLERLIKKGIVNPLADFWNLQAGPPRPKPAKADTEGAKDDGRGLVLPGYKYLGPFNGLDKGPPVNEVDEAAKKHDQAYNELLKQGDNPYVKFNHADHELQKDLQKAPETFGGNLARGVFQAKKRLLEPLGLVEPPVEGGDKKTAPTGRKGSRVDDHYPAVKKARVGSPDKDIEGAGEGPSDETNNGAGGSPVSVGSGIMAEGGGGPMGSDQQGADGVGNSSGNWHCDTLWMGDSVITRTTRTWQLPTYNNHLYKPVRHTASNNDANNQYFGYSTPWGYFDFNRFHCHFSPRDWQRLINNNWGIRPRALKFRLFNIQVKEVTTDNGTTTIANNLTSTIQIFADSDYQLPYVLGAATQGTLPPFPADVYKIPQYGYCTLNSGDNPVEQSAFYCLDYFSSQMLRTGNNFEFTFQFENVPFHSMYAHNQNIMRLMNPLLDQYLYGFKEVQNNSNKDITYQRGKTTNFSIWARNWLGGPSYKGPSYNREGGASNNTNFEGWAKGRRFKMDNITSIMIPGPPQASSSVGDPTRVDAQQSVGFAKNVYDLQDNQNLPNLNITNEDEIRPTNPVGHEYFGAASATGQTNSNAGDSTNLVTQGVLPGMNWQNRDIYLAGQIWAKIPHTDNTFHPNPMMGGFGLKHPPPMIFIKNTPVPANPTNSDTPAAYVNTKEASFITQYSTGQCSVEIEWELQKESSKRWNPEVQFTSNYGLNITDVQFAPNNSGLYQEQRNIGTRYLTRPL